MKRSVYYFLIFLIVLVFISTLYQIFKITSDNNDKTDRYNDFEKKVVEITNSNNWIRIRDIRDQCNSRYDSDIRRFSHISCRAEFAHRVRSNLGHEIINMYEFIDHWTNEKALAFELKIARNVTVIFKPCAVIPANNPLGIQVLEDQIAPSISTRLDSRQIRILLKDRPEWLQKVSSYYDECEQQKVTSRSKVVPRVPGCTIYLTEELLKWNEDTYGAKLEHILPLLRCRDVLLDNI